MPAKTVHSYFSFVHLTLDDFIANICWTTWATISPFSPIFWVAIWSIHNWPFSKFKKQRLEVTECLHVMFILNAPFSSMIRLFKDRKVSLKLALRSSIATKSFCRILQSEPISTSSFDSSRLGASKNLFRISRYGFMYRDVQRVLRVVLRVVSLG